MQDRDEDVRVPEESRETGMKDEDGGSQQNVWMGQAGDPG